MNNKLKNDSSNDGLRRELGLGDAVGLGLGAVIGAGIFVVSGVAAGIAGPAMLISLFIAGLAATFNGLSSAQLAAQFPKAGGTYEYGYEMLHPLAGFSAGWMFLISKLAAGGVVALGFGSYVQRFLPHIDVRWNATIAVIILIIANLVGIKKAGMLNRVIVTLTIFSLSYFIVAGFFVFDSTNLVEFVPYGFKGVAEASGIIFFAFTGYARIATLGEEISNPKQTIPRAIIITLIASVILYTLVSFVMLGAIGAEGMATAAGSPLFAAATVMSFPGIQPIIGISAITAMLGVLLSQILGISRMFFAMGRRKDLPQLFSKVSVQNSVPTYGVLVAGVIILLTVWLGELRFVTQTASFTILIYYSIANLSAIRLKSEERFLPAWISWLGLILCILMALSLPIQSILSGVILLVLGHLLRLAFK